MGMRRCNNCYIVSKFLNCYSKRKKQRYFRSFQHYQKNLSRVFTFRFGALYQNQVYLPWKQDPLASFTPKYTLVTSPNEITVAIKRRSYSKLKPEKIQPLKYIFHMCPLFAAASCSCFFLWIKIQ